jgi:hypothetical protein
MYYKKLKLFYYDWRYIVQSHAILNTIEVTTKVIQISCLPMREKRSELSQQNVELVHKKELDLSFD